MKRRNLLAVLLGLPVVAAVLPKRVTGFARAHVAPVGPENTFIMAGTVVFTREEVVNAKSLGALLRTRAESLQRSLLKLSAKEIERRGWRVVEYAENTTRP